MECLLAATILQKPLWKTRSSKVLLTKYCCNALAAGEGVPAGGYEGSPSCESTMPCGLTPKQRIAWKKEEERRRRQLELQVKAQQPQSAALWHDTVVHCSRCMYEWMSRHYAATDVWR